MLYRKSGESGPEALCIKHYNLQWQVKAESDLGTGLFVASVQGDCALEDCRSRTWKVSDGEGFVDEPSAKLVTEVEAKSQASGRSVLAPERTRASPSIVSCVFC